MGITVIETSFDGRPRDLNGDPADTRTPLTTFSLDTDGHGTTQDEAWRTVEIRSEWRILRLLQKIENWLNGKLGVELQGVDRIPDEKKQPPSLWSLHFLWWSLNIVFSALPVGLQGPLLGLSLQRAVVASIVGATLGACCPAFTATLGPKLGLRQMACSRYAFGFWGAKLCAILNVISQCGWIVITLVVAGETLSAVSDYTMSITVGIVLVAVLSYAICLFGFQTIHKYEKYAWFSTCVLLCVLIGQAAPFIDLSASSHDNVAGSDLAGPFLSFVAINFALTAGWCAIASDYTCHFRAATASWKIFVLSWVGIVLPSVWTVILGACLGNIAISAEVAPFADTYKEHGFGGLLSVVYHPVAWAKFCLVVLTFGVLGVMVAMLYSVGLSVQVLGHGFHAVPRFIWSLAAAIVAAVLAIVGQQSLSEIVENFISLLGYVSVSFTLILLLEDRIFRRRGGYDLTAWARPDKLPPGVAAVLAFVAGYFGGGVPGMAQTWYVGPVAAAFGGQGGDCGVYLCAAITVVVYAVARPLEKKISGR